MTTKMKLLDEKNQENYFIKKSCLVFFKNSIVSLEVTGKYKTEFID